MQNALVPISLTEEQAAQRTVEEAVCAYATRRPNADFIAQLIAAEIKAPQTCARRRATPDEAIAVYRAADHVPVAMGRSFSRSL